MSLEPPDRLSEQQYLAMFQNELLDVVGDVSTSTDPLKQNFQNFLTSELGVEENSTKFHVKSYECKLLNYLKTLV